jgi:prepilin-type N-terminal cleavage/methylation domain-containing protein
MSRHWRASGFTLVELLVVIAIIAVLAAVVSGLAASALADARTAKETAAGRQIMVGMKLHQERNRGKVLAGYDDRAEAYDAEGNALHHPLHARYPWRLAPYLDYKLDGTVLVNAQEKLARRGGASSQYAYVASLTPSLGMNIGHVGGDFSGEASGGAIPGTAAFKKLGVFCVTRDVQAPIPENLIAFASAHSRPDPQRPPQEGYFKVVPPDPSASYDPAAAPVQFGFLHLRHRGETAVAAMFDGSVRRFNATELRDMRHWSPVAQELDDPQRRFAR